MGKLKTEYNWRGSTGRMVSWDASTFETMQAVYPVEFYDDFLGSKLKKIIANENTVATWTCLDTDNDADVLLVANEPNGVVNIAVGATDVTQLSVLYFGDQLPFKCAQGLIFEARAAIHTLPDSGAGTELSEIEIGLASAHNGTANNIATNAWFAMFADDANIYYETDDGTTDSDDVDSGIDAVADAYHIYRIDMTSLAAVKFFIDGTQVGSKSMAAATAAVVQPYFRCSKTKSSANTAVGAIYLDYVKVWQNRS